MTTKQRGLSKATYDDDYNGTVTAYLPICTDKRTGRSHVGDAFLPGIGNVMAQYDRDKVGTPKTPKTHFSATIKGDTKAERKQWLIDNGFLEG